MHVSVHIMSSPIKPYFEQSKYTHYFDDTYFITDKINLSLMGNKRTSANYETESPIHSYPHFHTCKRLKMACVYALTVNLSSSQLTI